MTIRMRMKAATNPVAATAVPVDRVLSDASVLPMPMLMALELVLVLMIVTGSSMSEDVDNGWTNSVSWINEVFSGEVVLFNVPEEVSSVDSLIQRNKINKKSWSFSTIRSCRSGAKLFFDLSEVSRNIKKREVSSYIIISLSKFPRHCSLDDSATTHHRPRDV